MTRRARSLRIAKGISLVQAAAYIGIDPAALSRYERCFHDLRPDNLIKYAQLLGTTVEELHRVDPDEGQQPARLRFSARRRASIAGASSWQRSRSQKLMDAAKGGERVLEERGRAHFKRLAHMRWARRETVGEQGRSAADQG